VAVLGIVSISVTRYVTLTEARRAAIAGRFEETKPRRVRTSLRVATVPPPGSVRRRARAGPGADGPGPPAGQPRAARRSALGGGAGRRYSVVAERQSSERDPSRGTAEGLS